MCSITHLPMQHPVTAADGHTYEKSAIVHWLAQGKRKSPMTGQPMAHTNLVPNHTVKEKVDAWRGRRTREI